jgi:hypothetical protein
MVYSEAFNGLPPAVEEAVYQRIVDLLSENNAQSEEARRSADDRRAILEILTETKPDSPRH